MPLDSVLEAAVRAERSRMPYLGNVERATRVEDEYGGSDTEWLPAVEGIVFRLRPGGAGDRQLDQTIVDRLGNRAPYFMSVDADIALTSRDRIHQTFPDDKIFEILAESNEGVSFKTSTRLVVAEVL